MPLLPLIAHSVPLGHHALSNLLHPCGTKAFGLQKADDGVLLAFGGFVEEVVSRVGYKCPLANVC
jgi:hypothetical protein